MSNIVLVIEALIGLAGLLCVSSVRRNAGGAAAAATGAAGGLALMHSIYELSKRVGDTRFAQALSLLTAIATLLFVAKWFLSPVSHFLGRHDVLMWSTPILAALAWGATWKLVGIGFWAVLGLVWAQEVYADAELKAMTLGRAINVQNRCASTLTIRIASAGLITGDPAEARRWEIPPGTSSNLLLASGDPMRTYRSTVYFNARVTGKNWTGPFGPAKDMAKQELLPDKDGDLALVLECGT